MSALSLSLLLLSLYQLFLSSCVDAALSNRTIDDQLGDSVLGVLHAPTYSPAVFIQGADCSGCSFSQNVDLSKVFKGTWHDATHTSGTGPLTISASFTGVAVYVYNIIANNVPNVLSTTNLTLAVDGKIVDRFSYQAAVDATEEILYQYQVLSATGLLNGAHSLEIVAGGDENSLVLFDYIEYTFDDGVEESTVSPSVTSSSTTSSASVTSTSESSVTSTRSGTSSSSTIDTSSSPSTSAQPGSTTSSSPSISASPESVTGGIVSTPSDSTPSSTATGGTSGSAALASSSSNHREAAAIAGIVCGVVALLALILGILWFRRRHARARAHALAPSAVYLDKSDYPSSPHSGVDLFYEMRRASSSESSGHAPDRATASTVGLARTKSEDARTRETRRVQTSRDHAAAEEQIRMLEARVRMLETRRSTHADARETRDTQPGNAPTEVTAELSRLRNEMAVLRDEMEQYHYEREELPEYSG